MAEPIRISCTSIADIPSSSQIESWLANGAHVVLQFPPDTTRDAKTKLIADLASTLPEFSVFDSGGNSQSEWVTAMPVVLSRTVTANRTDIENALVAYRSECSRLMELYRADSLPPEYSADEHGGHCCFKHMQTGQTIEAPLDGFVDDNVDPYFFALFVKSTPEHSTVASVIRHDFHDAARMLDILKGSA